MTQVPPSKPERPRPPRDEGETSVGSVLPWEQGRLFSQLFSGEREREGEGKGLRQTKHPSMACTDLTQVGAFAEQLVPRLNVATQWPLQAAFFLPRLGRVDVTARREQGAWHVELDAEQEDARLWLGRVRQRCEERLSADLGRAVHLSVAESGNP